MQESIRSISLFFISIIFQCNGVSLRRQMEHIAKTRLESRGLSNDLVASRRYEFDPRELTQILGVPNRASHLPEAEAILPGHTLNRPAVGMLKSSIKFPHKELEDGSGVYGSLNNLGIKYDSRSERLLYSGFRRFPSDYIMVIPSSSGNKYLKPRFRVESTVLDLDKKDTKQKQTLEIIKQLNKPGINRNVKIYFGDMNNIFLNNLRSSEEVDTSYNENKYSNDEELFNLDDKKSALRNASETEDQKLNLIYPLSSEHASDIEQDSKTKKIQWLYKSKDSYNHIKINQEAPELNDFLPPMNENDGIRQWWFYNADDYKQFS